MNQLLRFLATNPWILIPIIVGLINAGVRIKQKADEQKARREAQSRMARQRADALRTGRPVGQTPSTENQPESAEAQRKARIEALRQQRMQQLQALREKRAGAKPASSNAPKGSPTPRPVPVAGPRASTASSSAAARRPVPGAGSSGHRATAAPAQKALQTRMPKLKGATQKPRSVPKGTRVAPVRRPQPAVTTARPRVQTTKQAATKRQALTKPISPVLQPVIKPVGSPIVPRTPSSLISARDMLRNRAQTRQAMVVREILASPVSLREPGSAAGSLHG